MPLLDALEMSTNFETEISDLVSAFYVNHDSRRILMAARKKIRGILNYALIDANRVKYPQLAKDMNSLVSKALEILPC